MSKYTSLMLFIPGSEHENERIKEVNSYQLSDNRTINLIDVNQPPFPDLFPRFIYCGSYNYFDLPPFLDFLTKSVNWESPEHIRLIVKEEDKESIDVYSLV